MFTIHNCGAMVTMSSRKSYTNKYVILTKKRKKILLLASIKDEKYTASLSPGNCIAFLLNHLWCNSSTQSQQYWSYENEYVFNYTK